MIFSAFANAIGAPLGGMLLDLHGLYNLDGWQWVFSSQRAFRPLYWAW